MDEGGQDDEHGESETSVVDGEQVAVHRLLPVERRPLDEQQRHVDLARLARLVEDDDHEEENEVAARAVFARPQEHGQRVAHVGDAAATRLADRRAYLDRVGGHVRAHRHTLAHARERDEHADRVERHHDAEDHVEARHVQQSSSGQRPDEISEEIHRQQSAESLGPVLLAADVGDVAIQGHRNDGRFSE